MSSRHYGWVVVAAGAVITCVAMGAMFSLPVYLAPIADDTGWSRAGISLAMTIGFVSMGVAGFAWGTLSDRIGARPIVMAAALIMAVGLVLASQATSLFVFQFAYGGLVGAAGGAFFAPIMAATVGWFDKHRSLAVSLVSVGSGVAPMVVTPFATQMITWLGWRMAMLSIALGAVAIILLASLFIRQAPDVEAQSAGASAPSTAEPAGSGASSALRSPQFLVLAMTFFFCCAAHSGPIFHTVSYAMLCGATPLAAASIYSVEGAAGLLGRVLFGVMGDRFGARRVIFAGLALQAIGIYAYVHVSELAGFYMLASVLGLVYGGVMPLYAVLARDYFGAKVMGTVLGAATMTSAIGMAFGPVGGGWLFDNYGSYYWLYIASAAVGLAAAAMALAFPPPLKQNVQGRDGEESPAANPA
ncbi:MFS transporter [Peteryoungia ipomoeae]|uniref:MFS transporter n=1 Tax=Peteryoungia ipomoeae TaxID=1210932 RepID=A0A4S8PB22_9HYPH|nr:MFS transporter [Peteryoungia ipomoeae]THV25324.1 MFS transporter [Peteryoungia ipomoeae]